MSKEITTLLTAGVKAYKDGNIREALRHLEQVLAQEPDNPEANFSLGLISVNSGDLSQSLSFFKKAIKAKPKVGRYWVSYIDALIRLDHIEDARVTLQQLKQKG